MLRGWVPLHVKGVAIRYHQSVRLAFLAGAAAPMRANRKVPRNSAATAAVSFAPSLPSAWRGCKRGGSGDDADLWACAQRSMLAVSAREVSRADEARQRAACGGAPPAAPTARAASAIDAACAQASYLEETRHGGRSLGEGFVRERLRARGGAARVLSAQVCRCWHPLQHSARAAVPV